MSDLTLILLLEQACNLHTSKSILCLDTATESPISLACPIPLTGFVQHLQSGLDLCSLTWVTCLSQEFAILLAG